jgi:nanoRNase/pAp phosphatase (c-di-AMP/oligoRNAs hydrolase)
MTRPNPASQASGTGNSPMTAFVESCVETAADSANAAEKHARRRPKVRRLFKLLAGKKRILITTHEFADPDGLASSLAMISLIQQNIPGAEVVLSVKGPVGGGLNEAFVRYTRLNPVPWDDALLAKYDAIILLDAQPHFAYSPLPDDVEPLAVIDHHGKSRRAKRTQFWDVRDDVGATSSIVFSYFLETDTPPSPLLAAALLYAIETDLAGAAGTPSELDNIALSSLTLRADNHKLYQMRYVDLPRSYYAAYWQALNTATWYDTAVVGHLDEIDSLEKPAVMADFLLRFDQVQSALVTAIHDKRMILSLRTSLPRTSAAFIMRKLVHRLGQGGGHRTKAGGFIPLQTGSESELKHVRRLLLRRLLRALAIKATPGKPLVPGIQ